MVNLVLEVARIHPFTIRAAFLTFAHVVAAYVVMKPLPTRTSYPCQHHAPARAEHVPVQLPETVIRTWLPVLPFQVGSGSVHRLPADCTLSKCHGYDNVGVTGNTVAAEGV